MDEIAELECLILTGARTKKNFVLSEKYVDLKHSAYLDTCFYIFFIENDLDSLYKSIGKMNYDRDGYRVRCINTDFHIDFNTRKKIERDISDIFPGGPDLKNPDIDFIVTKFEDRWIFGKVVSMTENRWLIFGKKPRTFCNALPSRMARALVNIAVGNEKGVKLLDPCCGMGTVLLEAMDIGIDAWGIDINEAVVRDANSNLAFFNFEKRARCMDATLITGTYDVSIVDLPYGVLSQKGSDKYSEIIGNMRPLCRRSVILSSRDISDIITEAGFKIAQGCIVHKGGLDRHITVCE